MTFFVDPERPLKPRGHAIRLTEARADTSRDIDSAADHARVAGSTGVTVRSRPIARCDEHKSRSDVCSQLTK